MTEIEQDGVNNFAPQPNALEKLAVRLAESEKELISLRQRYDDVSRSEVMLRSFFESSELCHLLVDKNLRLLDYNRSLEIFIMRMYGVQVRKGMLITDYMNEALVPDFLKHYEAALTGSRFQIERRLHYHDGTEIWWQFSFEPSRGACGNILAVSYTAANIDDRKRQEERIMLQHQRLCAISRLQSHELRRPVASIIGLMNLIKEENYQDCGEYLQMMERAVTELDEKIRYIVDQTSE